MAIQHTLQAQERGDKPGLTRREGYIPGVLYGHGFDSVNVQIEAREFYKIFSEAGSSTMVMLSVNGKEKHPVLIREVQYHPVRGDVMHSDFYRVRMDEKIRTYIPLEFVGESSAVKDHGGVFVRSIDEIEVEALPQDLPHDIEVDISVLTDFDTVIHISDITLPKGVEMIEHDHDEDEEVDAVVALVQKPRSEAELEELSEEVKEDIESVEGVAEEQAEGETEEGEDQKS